MPTDFPPTLDELYETFDDLPDWDERYDFIIDLGRELPQLGAEHQTEENRVHGCMSTVWLVTNVTDNASQAIDIQADSDSIIVKGLIVILLSVFSGKPAADIVKEDVEGVFIKLGLNQHLSPSRRNGLYSMVKRIRALATEVLGEQA